MATYRSYDDWKLATPWDDDGDESVDCPECGAELPAHWEDDEDGGSLVADEGCDCEDETEDAPVPDDRTEARSNFMRETFEALAPRRSDFHA